MPDVAVSYPKSIGETYVFVLGWGTVGRSFCANNIVEENNREKIKRIILFMVCRFCLQIYVYYSDACR